MLFRIYIYAKVMTRQYPARKKNIIYENELLIAIFMLFLRSKQQKFISKVQIYYNLSTII